MFGFLFVLLAALFVVAVVFLILVADFIPEFSGVHFVLTINGLFWLLALGPVLIHDAISGTFFENWLNGQLGPTAILINIALGVALLAWVIVLDPIRRISGRWD